MLVLFNHRLLHIHFLILLYITTVTSLCTYHVAPYSGGHIVFLEKIYNNGYPIVVHHVYENFYFYRGQFSFLTAYSGTALLRNVSSHCFFLIGSCNQRHFYVATTPPQSSSEQRRTPCTTISS
jgi:hypothetical protein